MSIIEIIKDIMKNEGITQVELAKKMGCSKQAINNIFKQKDMKISTVVMILYELGYCFEIKKIGGDYDE